MTEPAAPRELITSLELIAQLAERREKSNWRLRTYLKTELDTSDRELDSLVRETAKTVAAGIDCTACANCCKKPQPTVDATDIERLSVRLGISARAFRDEYVITDEFGDEVIAGRPCPFLADNRCSVYEDRPGACRDFPYLECGGFRERSMGAVFNYSLCPIVFNTVEELKRSTGFLAHERRRKRGRTASSQEQGDSL